MNICRKFIRKPLDVTPAVRNATMHDGRLVTTAQYALTRAYFPNGIDGYAYRIESSSLDGNKTQFLYVPKVNEILIAYILFYKSNQFAASREINFHSIEPKKMSNKCVLHRVRRHVNGIDNRHTKFPYSFFVSVFFCRPHCRSHIHRPLPILHQPPTAHTRAVCRVFHETKHTEFRFYVRNLILSSLYSSSALIYPATHTTK